MKRLVIKKHAEAPRHAGFRNSAPRNKRQNCSTNLCWLTESHFTLMTILERSEESEILVLRGALAKTILVGKLEMH